VDFAVRFHTIAEQREFTRVFRFEFPRCAMREEPLGVVWFGFRAWALDEQDAMTQAVLAVRYVAVRTRLRFRPVAEHAAVRDLGPVDPWEAGRARQERSALLAKLDDPAPDLIDARAGRGAVTDATGQLPARKPSRRMKRSQPPPLLASATTDAPQPPPAVA
jgi:hypothetical protein